MQVDLTALAGFPLLLETDKPNITTDGGLRLESTARRMQQMVSVLLEPQALPPEAEVYWICRLYDDRPEGVLAQARLAFACVLVPPLRIGREFAKTQGHYHPAMPGSRMAYPEVYTHYFGRLYLLMQRRVASQAGCLDDCVLIDMQPGQSVMVPPGYAHILINPSEQPALMAGLYSPEFTADYEPIRSMAGAAYYVINSGGMEHTLPNLRYSQYPALRRLTDLSGTRFAAPDNSRSLWASLLHDPRQYDFLSEADAARRCFASEDQQL